MKHYLGIAWEIVKEVIRLGLLALIPIVIDQWIIEMPLEIQAIMTAILRAIEKALHDNKVEIKGKRVRLPI